MVAASVRSSTTLASATRTNSTVTAPAGAVTGTDVIFVFLLCGGSTLAVPTEPGGWTLVESLTYSAPDPWAVSLQVWRKTHDGAASWTFSHASRTTQARVHAVQDADTTTPIDVAPVEVFRDQAVGGPASITVPSLTPVTPDTLHFIGRGSWDGNAITPPTGFTEDHDTPVLWVGWRTYAPTTATGTVTLAHGNLSTTSAWGAFMFAVRPAGSGGTPGNADGATARLSLHSRAGEPAAAATIDGATVRASLRVRSGEPSAGATVDGSTARLYLAVPAGSVTAGATAAGGTVTLGLAARPGAPSGEATIPGATGTLSITARPGEAFTGAIGAAEGATARLSLTARPGDLAAAADVLGATSRLSITARPGDVTAGDAGVAEGATARLAITPRAGAVTAVALPAGATAKLTVAPRPGVAYVVGGDHPPVPTVRPLTVGIRRALEGGTARTLTGGLELTLTQPKEH